MREKRREREFVARFSFFPPLLSLPNDPQNKKKHKPETIKIKQGEESLSAYFISLESSSSLCSRQTLLF